MILYSKLLWPKCSSSLQRWWMLWKCYFGHWRFKKRSTRNLCAFNL